VAKHPDNAKWFLNVKWQMEGVDINLDVNIGKQLSALGHTLTMLTGSEEDDEPASSESPDSDDGDQCDGQKAVTDANAKTRKSVDSLPSFLFDTTLDPKKRSLLMENEITEQIKIVNDLRTLGASANTIVSEERRLQELQAVCYKYFRRDMIQVSKTKNLNVEGFLFSIFILFLALATFTCYLILAFCGYLFQFHHKRNFNSSILVLWQTNSHHLLDILYFLLAKYPGQDFNLNFKFFAHIAI
jgi:hypothetical protein